MTMVLLQTLRSHPVGIKLGKLVPVQAWEARPSLVFSLGAFTMVASLMLGGGTRSGFLSDALLELLAIPALLIASSSLCRQPWTGQKRSAKWALLICFAIAVLPMLQLIPLPPVIWRHLPHREEVMAVFDVIDRTPPWLPASMAPDATWLSVLSLLPPTAVFICALQLSYRERRHLTLILLAVGIASAILGLLQVAQGPSSSLRFFAFTNPSDAVGFFANRNHFAALLYVLMMYAAAWATDLAFLTGSWRDLRSIQTSSVAMLTASLLVIVILIAAETITRSRAGVGLMIVGMLAAFALPFTDRRRAGETTPIKLLVGAMLIALLFVVQFALYRVLDRFAADPLQNARFIFARNTLSAALAFMPFGSGFGTFVSVYPMFERAEDTLANIYANHAHNDILEVCLEGGAVAVSLIVGFAVWFMLQARQIWLGSAKDLRPVDGLLMRSATFAVALVIAHSFFDYPLRTDAMMAVFAFSCALLIEPMRRAEPAAAAVMTAVARTPHRERTPPFEPPRPSAPLAWPSSDSAPPVVRPSNDLPVPSQQTGGRWGEGVAWPEEWSKPADRKPGSAGKGGKKEGAPE